ncbi:hypothetical protein E1B28_003084 [Marasmius oreades]|nr:uncharacterized protein E1B28_003084 [Marasmius oreades]KAG7085525.1 hypothetical protein E1B28_003084 [Marasmius oreades]
MTEGSERYPSWLPKRPDPPAPTSLRSFTGILEPSSPGLGHPTSPIIGGRKPTPRSIRIVSFERKEAFDRDQRQASDYTRVASPLYPRVWSRGVTPGLSPTVGVSTPPRVPQPRFRSREVNFDILRNPSLLSHIYFYLFPILTLAHNPLQTFLDFNCVFMLVQVSKFPSPKAPDVPGSGRNWVLGVTAYVACWLIWIIIIFIVYEIIYSFVRRWRTKRPSIFPIYTSTPARNLASMTSYTTFSFLLHIRYSAFIPARGGSIRDGLAETFYFYSQNLPTVALLLPRAGLSLALLLAFSTPDPNVLTLVSQGSSAGRDATFFNRDGTLTAYASGILKANVAWTLWRALVLLISWIGLWILSGHACAGLCGPRYRWEEEDLHEKNRSSLYSLGAKDTEAACYDPDAPLPWSWKEGTRTRIWDAYVFCSNGRRGGGGGGEEGVPQLPYPDSPGSFEGIERLMAAVGLAPSPTSTQHKRGALSEDVYRTPTQSVASGNRVKSSPPLGVSPLDLTAIIPKIVPRTSRSDRVPQSPESGGPLAQLPYPFASKGIARVSSADVEVARNNSKVPFPPSPSFKSAAKSSSSKSVDRSTGQVDEEDDDEDDDDEDEVTETEDTGRGTSSGDPSSPSARPSTSLSSLGRPVPPRYPFNFRQPFASGSQMTPSSNGRSIASMVSHQTHSTQMSRSTASTGNYDSTDYSPRSQCTSSDPASPDSALGALGIPMPPPPRTQRLGARARAGTVPAAGTGSSSSSSPNVGFPRSGRQRARTRGGSAGRFVEAFGQPAAYGMSSPEPGLYSSDVEREYEDEGVEGVENLEESMMMEQPEPDGPQEEEEGDDVVALLSSSRGQSPRGSLRQRANSTTSLAHRRSSLGGSSGSGGSGSPLGSNPRTHSHSGSSSGRSRAGSMTGAAVHSRTQSLLQTVRSASRSSLEMVQNTVMRSRANSMARLEDDDYQPSDRTHSRSGSASDAITSGGEGNTFGYPSPWYRRERTVSEEQELSTSTSVPQTPRVPDIYVPEPSGSYSQEMSRPDLREARSDLSGNAPSLQPSESTVRGEVSDVPSNVGLMRQRLENTTTEPTRER